MDHRSSSQSSRSFDSWEGFEQFYNSMPSTASSPPNVVHELPDSQEFKSIELDIGEPTWRSFFNFTESSHLPHLLASFTLTILSSLLQPTGAIIYGKIFSVFTLFGSGRLSASGALQQTSTLCVALVVLGIISWFVESMFMSTWLGFGELQAKSVRQQMFANMLRKDMDWYDMRQDGIGSLLIRIETQIRELQLSVSQPFGFCMYEIAVSAVALGLGFYLSWKLTLVILVSLPLLAVILFAVSRHLAPAIEAQKHELSVASKYTNTAIANINTVKAYNGQDHEIWQYFNTVKKVTASYMVQARANAMQFGFIKCATVGLFVQGFWFGLVLVNQGLDPGRVYTTYYACMIAMQSIEIVLPQWLVLAKGKSAGHTLKSIMMGLQKDQGRKLNRMDGFLIPLTCNGDIEIKNVSFSYPSNPEQKVMTAANFFFPAKETTYIIGRSGSGKSTVGNLLMRYYDFQEGDILVDDRPIQTLNVDWLRENVTLVQQQSVLFNETILQNIAFGRSYPASREEILEAVHTADLYKTLDDLPGGLETMIGSTGKSLSGGQQQRVALARARLRDSAIVILDEATSALDQKSRALVMERIREWRKGKTTIIITHDVSRILDDEYVYVLENGAIVQEGYCKTLAEKKHGTFASFVPVDPSVSSLSARRNSEPLSPVTPSPESGLPDFDELYSGKGFISKFLRQQDTFSKQALNDGHVPFGSISRGVGTVRDNAAQALEYWTTPELPNQARFSYLEPSKRSTLSPTQTGIHFQSNIVSVPFLSPTDDHPNSIQLQDIYPRQPLLANASPDRQLQFPQQIRTSNRDVTASFRPLPLARLDTQFATSSGMSRTRPARSPKPKLEFNSVHWRKDTSQDAALDPKNSVEDVSKSSKKHSSAEAFLIREESDKPKNRKAASITQILRTIWPILNAKDRSILLLGFLASFIVAVLTPAFAYFLAQLLNVYYLPENRSAIAMKWALILIGIAIVDGFATFVSHLALEHAAQQWVNGLRVEALKRIFAQPKSWFDKEKNSPDRLSECLDRNAEEMRNLVGRFLGPIFITTWMMSITIVWALIISYKLTLVAMSCVPIVYLSTRVFDWVSTKWESECNDAASKCSSIFIETITNIRVVKALTLENHFKQKHEKAVQAAWKTGLRRGIYSGLCFGLNDSESFFVVATIFRFGSVLITSGQLPLLNMLQVINLLLFGIANMVSLLNMMPQINSSRTTGTQMLYLAQLPRSSSHESSGTQRLATPFPVIFKDLSFTYPNRSEGKTLDRINLTIEAGTCTAIVGSSGSGKSTIASLLLGLYPPDQESFTSPSSAPLTFAHVPISNLNLHSLRNFISLVAQQPLLFPTTIYANLIYGLPDTSPFQTLSCAIRAAQDAGIHDFISSLPFGYQTPIGEGGVGLSGGQAQRIAIARALVRRPKILVLDEATSALDRMSADAVRDCVGRIMERARESEREEKGSGTAILLIAHDVEMMRVADRVVVVEKGKVVEEGSLNELSRRGRAFRTLIGLDVDLEVGGDDGRGGEGEGDESPGEGWSEMTPVKPRSKGTWVQLKRGGSLRQGSI